MYGARRECGIVEDSSHGSHRRERERERERKNVSGWPLGNIVVEIVEGKGQ